MGEDIVVDQIHVRMHPELRRLVLVEAMRHPCMSVSDFITGLLADHFNKPELARVPRKRMGRPPKLNKNGKAELKSAKKNGR